MRKGLLSLTIILTLVTLLFQYGCGVSRIPPTGERIYDIRGVWEIILGVGNVWTKLTCTFTGTKEEGIVTPDYGYAGTYKVGGETGIQVKFDFYASEEYPDSWIYCVGRFIDANYMEGSGSIAWSAIRKESF